MVRVNVRRLAAVDMHGAGGTRFRRRAIVAEFVLGATLGPALGVILAATTPGLGFQLFGVWLAGACLNYIPLAAHAISLLRPGALESELAGVDVRGELRHYTGAQVWLAVPLLFIVLAVVQLDRKG